MRRRLSDFDVSEWIPNSATASYDEVQRGWSLWCEARAAHGESFGIQLSNYVERCELERTLSALGLDRMAI